MVISHLQVKSFGTEGRGGPGHDIPANPNTYPSIVFKGSDIKDLRVEESQNVTPAVQQPVQQNWYNPATAPHYMQSQAPAAFQQPMYWQPPSYLPHYNSQPGYPANTHSVPVQNPAYFDKQPMV